MAPKTVRKRRVRLVFVFACLPIGTCVLFGLAGAWWVDVQRQRAEQRLEGAIRDPMTLEVVSTGFARWGVPDGKRYTIRDENILQAFTSGLKNRTGPIFVPPHPTDATQKVDVIVTTRNGNKVAISFHGETVQLECGGVTFDFGDPDGGPRTAILKWIQAMEEQHEAVPK